MTISIELGFEEEQAFRERARLSGLDPSIYARQVIRDHVAISRGEASSRKAVEANPMIDHEFLAYCDREGDPDVTLEKILETTSKIEGSMSRVIIEETRADRL